MFQQVYLVLQADTNITDHAMWFSSNFSFISGEVSGPSTCCNVCIQCCRQLPCAASCTDCVVQELYREAAVPGRRPFQTCTFSLSHDTETVSQAEASDRYICPH